VHIIETIDEVISDLITDEMSSELTEEASDTLLKEILIELGVKEPICGIICPTFDCFGSKDPKEEIAEGAVSIETNPAVEMSCFGSKDGNEELNEEGGDPPDLEMPGGGTQGV